MALGSNPSRDQIWNELTESTYRNGGTNVNSLKNMDAYVFGGDGSGYTRDGFGGYGIPAVSSLSVTSGDSKLTCNFTVDDDGGLPLTFVAQYWEDTPDVNPSPYFEEIIGFGTGTGSESHDLSGVSNGTTYEVRVTAFNDFNNSENYPAPRGTNQWWDWTNTATGTPQQPTLSTPTLIQGYAENLFNELDLTFACGGNQDNLVVQYRVDGGTIETASIQCSSGLTTTSPELIVQINEFVSDSQTVEARAKATATGYSDSPYGNFQTLTFDTVRSCPI